MFIERSQALANLIENTSFTQGATAISHLQALEKACTMLTGTRERKGIVYVIGNGGSAGIASHFSNDLVKALEIPSYTLYDSNLMTCLSNDYGYEHVFSHPLKIMLKKEDLLVAISSSGKSPNILNATAVAKSRGTPLITLSGFAGENPLRKTGDLNFYISSFEYGLVEAAHFFLLHTLIDSLLPQLTHAK